MSQAFRNQVEEFVTSLLRLCGAAVVLLLVLKSVVEITVWAFSR